MAYPVSIFTGSVVCVPLFQGRKQNVHVLYSLKLLVTNLKVNVMVVIFVLEGNFVWYSTEGKRVQ